MSKAPEITALSAVLACVLLGLILGMMASGARINLNWTNGSKPNNSVALSIIADYGGSGMDSFVFADTVQKASVIHVSAGQVAFTINNLDTALNVNYNKTANVSFTFLNDTANGVVRLHYNAGDHVSMVISHTFTIDGIGEVPLSPDTTTTFALNLKAGTYHYYCIVPCGPGMNFAGYMQGDLVVQ